MPTDSVASGTPGSPPRLSPAAVQASREVRVVISRLRRRILGASEAEDLTLGQSTALARIARETETPATAAGVTTSVLAAAEGVRHQSMTATVAALAARGLVVRTPDPEDGRRLLITLTPEGRRRVHEGRQARAEWLATRLQEECTQEELQAVIAAMSVLERLTHD
ncbi:MarR family winged helix-turn-helix transcriptional regulator [Streptomyces cylindrosporus]|uniref:MarR family transcriptional regulator n=1 Tax=Streptomyces cylindrosporus TaxID=2927583 RepID=A0ABS9YQ26_9ACTN|nr:MarR family transcriptional regulator [Streptomyces cylindrosporus]MCI3279366.1 MarR family transcriptional regulator [Streptomyces cylindrosporus]